MNRNGIYWNCDGIYWSCNGIYWNCDGIYWNWFMEWKYMIVCHSFLRLTIWAIHLMWDSFTLSTPKMRFSKTLTCKGKFYEILTIPHQFAHMGDYAFKYAWNHESNYLIIFPLCAFYQEYYNLWNSSNRWISNLKVALTMFLKMIPPIASTTILKFY